MKNTRIVAVLYAFIAALFYAFSTPFSKILLREVPEVMMASFLYLGAGVGVGIMYSFHWRKEEKGMRLEKRIFPMSSVWWCWIFWLPSSCSSESRMVLHPVHPY